VYDELPKLAAARLEVRTELEGVEHPIPDQVELAARAARQRRGSRLDEEGKQQAQQGQNNA
jgi:hypothetical protein